MATTAVKTYDQVISKASDELQSLEKVQSDIGAERQAVQVELAAIQARTSSRNAALHALRQELAALEAKHDAVELEHRLSVGTDLALAISRSLKGIVTELQTKRREIADLEKGTAEEAKDAAQLQRLQSDLAGQEKRLQEIDTKRAAVQAARDQFFAAQGEAEALAIREHLVELNAFLRDAQHAEQEAHAALLRFADEAREQLAPWPALQRQVRGGLLYEDASTRILELAIALRDALLSDGKHADIHPDILRQAGMWGSSLAGEIAMEVQNLWPAVTLTGKPESLINQKRRLEKLRQTYIDVKSGR